MSLRSSLLAAVAAVALSATAVFAHQMPETAEFGLGTAREASGQDVPVGHVDGEHGDEDSEEQPLEEDPVEEQIEEDEDGEHCIDPFAEDDATIEDGEEPNHGAIVCGAAQAETPEGCLSHGQWVRSFSIKGWLPVTDDDEACRPDLVDESEPETEADAEADTESDEAGAQGGRPDLSAVGKGRASGGGGAKANAGGHGKGRGGR